MHLFAIWLHTLSELIEVLVGLGAVGCLFYFWSPFFFRFLSSGLRNQIIFLYFQADGICLTGLHSFTHTFLCVWWRKVDYLFRLLFYFCLYLMLIFTPQRMGITDFIYFGVLGGRAPYNPPTARNGTGLGEPGIPYNRHRIEPPSMILLCWGHIAGSALEPHCGDNALFLSDGS